MQETQPPLECQFCHVDLRSTPHKMVCRIVTDIHGIEGWLDLPAFLDKRPKKPAVVTNDVFS